MIGFVTERLMEQGWAAHGKKSAERLHQRNGYLDRVWRIWDGTLELRIPKLRKGSYFPGFPEPQRMARTALTAVTWEAYTQADLDPSG